MANVFVTGSSGLLGAATVARLEKLGHQVTGLSRRPAQGRNDVVGDLLTPASYADALTNADVVVHLAAVTGKAPIASYGAVNDEGTRMLLETCRRAGQPRFIFCSSIAAGFADLTRYYYAASKLAAERHVAASGLAFTTIRPTIIAGRHSPVMSRLAGLARLPVIPAFAGGRVRVQPIAADDVAAFIGDIVETSRFAGETLELGGPDVLSMRDLLGRLRHKSTQNPARFLPVPAAPLAALLAVLESVAYGVLPLSVGQLATFRYDGTASPNSLWESRRAQLTTVDEMVEGLVTHA